MKRAITLLWSQDESGAGAGVGGGGGAKPSVNPDGGSENSKSTAQSTESTTAGSQAIAPGEGAGNAGQKKDNPTHEEMMEEEQIRAGSD